jgi:hypothetical protein
VSGGIAPRILELSTRWDEWSVSRPDFFTPRERAPITHWIGGCVGPSAGLDAIPKLGTSSVEYMTCTGKFWSVCQPNSVISWFSAGD